jgi:hypothetical protein
VVFDVGVVVGLGVGVIKMGAVKLILVVVVLVWGISLTFFAVGSWTILEGVVLFKVSLHESVKFVIGKAVVTFTPVTIVLAAPYTKSRHDETRICTSTIGTLV